MEPVSREQIVAIIRQRADRLRDAEVRAVRLRELMRIRDNRVGRNIEPAINGQDPVPLVEPRERGLPEVWPVGEQAIRPRVPPAPPPVALGGGIRNQEQPQGLAPRHLDPLGGHPVMFLGDRNGAPIVRPQIVVDHPNQRMQDIERDNESASDRRKRRNREAAQAWRVEHRARRVNALALEEGVEDAQRLLRAQNERVRAERGPLFRQATIPSDEDDCGSYAARTTINVSVEGDIVSYASSPDQPSSVGLFISGKCLK